jgi:signal transduction histidine kinase
LHLAILQLSSADRQQTPAQEPIQEIVQETLHTLAETHQQIAALLTASQPAPSRGPDPCELVSGLHALVESDFAHTFEAIRWQGLLDGEEENGKDRQSVYVDPVVGEVLLGAAREMIRNAASHGGKVERAVHLQIGLCQEKEDKGDSTLTLTIEDDGVGMDASRAMHKAGSNGGGSGNGLALHSTLLAMVGGYLTVESPPQGGTLVRVTVAGLEQG